MPPSGKSGRYTSASSRELNHGDRRVVTSPAAYVFQTHAGTQKGGGFRIELSRRALNTPDERFGTERSTREDVLYIPRGVGRKDAVCTRLTAHLAYRVGY